MWSTGNHPVSIKTGEASMAVDCTESDHKSAQNDDLHGMKVAHDMISETKISTAFYSCLKISLFKCCARSFWYIVFLSHFFVLFRFIRFGTKVLQSRIEISRRSGQSSFMRLFLWPPMGFDLYSKHYRTWFYRQRCQCLENKIGSVYCGYARSFG